MISSHLTQMNTGGNYCLQDIGMNEIKSNSMTDDELIMLWSLAGMELWAEFKSLRDLEWFVKFMTESGVLLTTVSIGIVYNTNYTPSLDWAWFSGSAEDTLCVIGDILSFNPDERWWKLLFAKRWYERNKEQFNDG